MLEYFIPYQIEKFNLIKKLHENTIHKGTQTLYESIKQSNFWWIGIYQDVKNYIKNCSICQQVHKLKARKPEVKQIISNCPKERYVVDLINITPDIDNKEKKYKYIMNIIDHYSKWVGSYILENKNAKNVLYGIHNFISLYEEPKILKSDNGREFSNKYLDKYYEDKYIILIHSSVRHPTTNRVCEAVHKDIVKSLLVEKLINKNYYNIKISLENAVKAIIIWSIQLQNLHLIIYFIIIPKI